MRPFIPNILLVTWILMLNSGELLRAQTFQEVEVRDLLGTQANFGTAVADYDGDGDLDLFVVANTSFDPDVPHTWSRLLKNRGGFFEDATIEAKLANQYFHNSQSDEKVGASWGDFDNDGFPDLLLTHANAVQLYRNNTDGTFEDVTGSANITSCSNCVNTAGLWWDYDNDGDLDLYISNYIGPNWFLKNLNDGTFEEVTSGAGLGDQGSTWFSLPIDANSDGWMDLLVVNDFGNSRFYVNQQGLSFEEATEEYGLVNKGGNNMGATVGDYNSDGIFDIYITNIAEFEPNVLFQGQPAGGYVNQSAEEEVGNGHWGWGTHFFDADHDGDEDLYLVNGWLDLSYENKFFKNLRSEGQEKFEDWSVQAACNGSANGMGAEVFDYDNDGDLDILVSNSDANHPNLYQNLGGVANTNWVQVELEGTTSNRDAIGARLVAAANGRLWHRFHHGAALMGQSLKPVHFGLGIAHSLDSLTVIWPNGDHETVYDIPGNQIIRIIEGSGMEEVVTAVEPEPVEETQVRVFPNPFQENVEFELPVQASGQLYFQIHSLQGQKIFELHQNITAPGMWTGAWGGFDNNGLRQASGLYLYTIRLGQDIWSGKLIYHK